MTETIDERIARVTFTADGLVAAIVQQWDTREVLMLGWMDAEALRRTLTSGRVTLKNAFQGGTPLVNAASSTEGSMLRNAGETIR